jgi:hypothetical protein
MNINLTAESLSRQDAVYLEIKNAFDAFWSQSITQTRAGAAGTHSQKHMQAGRRAALLLFGLSARTDKEQQACSIHGKAAQLLAAASQEKFLLRPLVASGYRVDTILVTNDCPRFDSNGFLHPPWIDVLQSMYRPFAATVHIDSDSLSGHRLHRALHALRSSEYITGQNLSVVILTRPDLIWLTSKFSADALASPTSVVQAWEGCDVIFAMPPDMLNLLAEKCIGRCGCFSTFDARAAHLEAGPIPNHRECYNEWNPLMMASGHYCAECARMIGLPTSSLVEGKFTPQKDFDKFVHDRTFFECEARSPFEPSQRNGLYIFADWAARHSQGVDKFVRYVDHHVNTSYNRIAL